jgi:hypothetical protein
MMRLGLCPRNLMIKKKIISSSDNSNVDNEKESNKLDYDEDRDQLEEEQDLIIYIGIHTVDNVYYELARFCLVANSRWEYS